MPRFDSPCFSLHQYLFFCIFINLHTCAYVYIYNIYVREGCMYVTFVTPKCQLIASIVGPISTVERLLATSRIMSSSVMHFQELEMTNITHR